MDDTYNLLVKFIDENKKIPNSGSNNQHERKLGDFSGKQRQAKIKGKLSQERIDKLNMIEIWYWDFDKKTELEWNEKYNNLVEFVKIKNKIPTSKKSNTEYERLLASFASHQRRNKKANKLSQEKIEKLEKINGWYWS